MVAGGSTFINADTMAPIGIRTIQTNTILAGDSFETHFSEYYQIMRTHWGKLYKIDIIKKMNLSNLNVVPYGRDILLRDHNIYARKYFYPTTADQECFKGKYDKNSLDNARTLSRKVLVIPFYEKIDMEVMDQIVKVIRESGK